jgi:AcrR family transcriptional regulator
VRVSKHKRKRPARVVRPTRSYLAADDRRREILEVAKTVFASSGYHRANIADICEGAGIARGTLYQYFENKHSVLLAILAETAERVAQLILTRPTVTPLPEGTQAPSELIAAFCHRRLKGMLEAVVADQRVLRILVKSRGLDVEVDTLNDQIEGQILAVMERDIRFVQTAGIARAGDPKAIARLLFGGIEKLVLSKLSAAEAIDVDAIVPLVVDLQLFGLVRDELRPSPRLL